MLLRRWRGLRLVWPAVRKQVPRSDLWKVARLVALLGGNRNADRQLVFEKNIMDLLDCSARCRIALAFLGLIDPGRGCHINCLTVLHEALKLKPVVS